MACVAMDTSFPDSDQAIRLGRRLKERLAWCHMLRIWSWGIDQNREDGTLRLDSKRIAEVASWRGDHDDFVAALVEVGLLRKLDDGAYYMAGWSRNKEYFSKKRRMSKYRGSKKTPTTASPETPLDASLETQKVTPLETSQVTHSLSLSLSPSLSLVTHTRAHETASQVETPQLGDSVSADRFEVILSSPPYCWRPPPHSARLRIAACCPVPIDIWDSSLKITMATDKPNYGYFASVLESESKRAREGPPLQQRRGGKVGYHPGSPPEEFVDGRVELPPL